ncbi:uncharacterized protein N7459_002708 [Penicillium hispanicum]|uniref:uncharacterized protein n=1 Tax=Penicillium hispanicum TaxID=1080232 RepID=UPI002541443F|nr:uncharacterized protein N7459_002708 [Penicillium hispanicum]KAJ5586943.1 hypothetical protein N7459_002708 [Penicillium hispanicum]
MGGTSKTVIKSKLNADRKPNTESPGDEIYSLYHGPLVKIRVCDKQDEKYHDFTVSKNLLCKHSSYFKAMLEGQFRESDEQTVTLPYLEGVVSIRSFERLLQWLYRGEVNLGSETPAEEIAGVIEFSRLVDMCNVSGIESEMGQRVKQILIAHGDCGDYSKCIDSQHILSAINLPATHVVRSMLVSASIEGYLRNKESDLSELLKESPAFASDLLVKLQPILGGLSVAGNTLGFKDPISERWVDLCRISQRKRLNY